MGQRRYGSVAVALNLAGGAASPKRPEFQLATNPGAQASWESGPHRRSSSWLANRAGRHLHFKYRLIDGDGRPAEVLAIGFAHDEGADVAVDEVEQVVDDEAQCSGPDFGISEVEHDVRVAADFDFTGAQREGLAVARDLKQIRRRVLEAWCVVG